MTFWHAIAAALAVWFGFCTLGSMLSDDVWPANVCGIVCVCLVFLALWK